MSRLRIKNTKIMIMLLTISLYIYMGHYRAPFQACFEFLKFSDNYENDIIVNYL